MKKSISAILVAALMLVAFTACNNEVPAYKVPTGLTIQVTRTDYLVGEAVDPSTISGTVDFFDGSSKALSGTELSYSVTGGSNGLIGKGANTILSTYGGTLGADNTLVSASARVMGYEVEKVVLGNLPTEVTQGTTPSTTASVPTDDVTVTVTYDNGQKTRDLVAGEYNLQLTVDDTTPTDPDVEDDEVALYPTLTVFGQPVNARVITAGSVEVIEAEDVHGPAVSITSIALATDAHAYIGDNATNKALYEVKGDDEDGNEVTLDASDFTLYFGNGVESGKFTATSATVYVQLNSDKSQTNSTTITVEDYIVSVRVANGSGEPVTSVDNVTRNTAPEISTPNKIQVCMASDNDAWIDYSGDDDYFDVPVLNSTAAFQNATLYVPTGKADSSVVSTTFKFNFATT